MEQNSKLSKQVERFQQHMLGIILRSLEEKLEPLGDQSMIVSRIEVDNPTLMRDLAFQVRSRYPGISLALGAEIEGKAHLAVMISDLLLKEHHLNAAQIIKEVAPLIQGGGGGQPFFATAGGKNPKGLDSALQKAREILIEAVGD